MEGRYLDSNQAGFSTCILGAAGSSRSLGEVIPPPLNGIPLFGYSRQQPIGIGVDVSDIFREQRVRGAVTLDEPMKLAASVQNAVTHHFGKLQVAVLEVDGGELGVELLSEVQVFLGNGSSESAVSQLS